MLLPVCLRGGRPTPYMATSTKRSWKLQEFVAHGASVTCLALGRKSGRVMVTGGEDKKVNLWALGKPNCIMSLSGHTSPVECVKFGLQEDVVCAGSVSGALKVWDLEAAKIIRTLTGHKANVKCLDFHPYGDFVASGSADNNIKLWDIRRKGCIYTYKGHSKTVNSLKFSPDGRWIASGGDDGVLKLWDLPAGKLLTEFRGHTAAVTDVEFHPNEFLLASSSIDRTVKFWDLESYLMVSTTDGDSGPVRCIYFNPDGECLFSGAQDLLKVYGWEPARTFDTLVMGWGKVVDVTASQNQLIAGAFSSTNVSVYIVDLKRVQPFGTVPNHNMTYIAQSALHNIRKSFVKGQNNGKNSDCLELKTIDDTESLVPDIDPDDASSFADIKERDDYDEIFHTKREYIIRNPNSPSKAKSLNNPQPFLPPLESSSLASPVMSRHSERKAYSSVSTTSTAPSHQMNVTYSKIPDVIGRTITPTASTTAINLPTKPIDKSTSVIRQNHLPESAIISVVRPVPIIPEKDSHPQRAVVFPELKQRNSNYLDFVPDQRDRPVGLDLEDFLPRHLQDSLKFGIQSQPEMSEAEAMSSIFRGHESMTTVLAHRRKNLQIILAVWSSKGVKAALESVIHMHDSAVLVDILNIVTLRPSVWNLDMCQILLPSIYDLLQSKFESYMTAGCLSLKLILKNFSPVIKSNITAPPGVGVDISREERYNKCMSCFNQLVSIRAFLLKRQTLQGKLGQSFRELHILMQSLE